MDKVIRMVSESPVVIFSKSTGSHTVMRLLSDFGVNPTVYELDQVADGREIEQALSRSGSSPAIPAVFIGGKLVGSTNEVMSLHLSGSLIPMLRRVGAM